MHVDWGWIKQRPHYLAECLSKKYTLTILYPYSWRRNNLVTQHNKKLFIAPFFRLPLSGSCNLIKRINIALLNLFFKAFLKINRYDIIWVSSPEVFEFIPRTMAQNVLYDCMDDYCAFPSHSGAQKDELYNSEVRLIEKSEIIFCSSFNLLNKIKSRASKPKKIIVINNAFEPDSFSVNLTATHNKLDSARIRLGYIGTISNWLDLNLLLSAVCTFESIEFHLIGPIENLDQSHVHHERIKFYGPIPHDHIQLYASNFDVLIMPFKLNDLVQSVDPVKLYEYIYLDKPIISIRYLEVERFNEFVDFYESEEEFFNLLDFYMRGGMKKKYNKASREKFILDNTWAKRANLICESIDEIFNPRSI